jgi:MFS family permease
LTTQRKRLTTESKRPRLFYGYVIVGSAFTIQILAWGIYNTFGVFIDPLQKEFLWSRASISGAISLSYLLYGGFGILAGHLNDRIGPRILMTGCGALLGIGYFLMSQIDSIFHLYLFFGLVIGIGISGGDVIPLSTAARWFVKRRGVMTGIIKVGTGVGMTVMPLFINWLLAAYGWRLSFAVLGIFLLISVSALAQFLVGDPAHLRLMPDGKSEPYIGDAKTVETVDHPRIALGSRHLWVICILSFLIYFCVVTILMHIVPHAIDLGISAPLAAIVLAVIGLASIAGRFVMGWAGDRLGHRVSLILSFLLLTTAFLWIQSVKKLPAFYVFAVVYGFAHGGFFALLSPTVADLFGTRSHGLLFGIVVFCGTLGGFTGPTFAGYVFDVTKSYQLVFQALTILSITGLLLTMALRSPIEVGVKHKRRPAS